MFNPKAFDHKEHAQIMRSEERRAGLQSLIQSWETEGFTRAEAVQLASCETICHEFEEMTDWVVHTLEARK